MLGAQVAPNEISFSSAISACEASAQWQLALELLAAMPEFKVTPNHVCFNAVISAFEKFGLWQKAFQVLVQMESTIADIWRAGENPGLCHFSMGSCQN